MRAMWTVFQVGDRVLLRTKDLVGGSPHTLYSSIHGIQGCGPRTCPTPPTRPDIGQLRPRWDDPLTVIACPSPNAYTLGGPSRCRVACAAALPSTSIATNPSLSVPGPRRPPEIGG